MGCHSRHIKKRNAASYLNVRETVTMTTNNIKAGAVTGKMLGTQSSTPEISMALNEIFGTGMSREENSTYLPTAKKTLQLLHLCAGGIRENLMLLLLLVIRPLPRDGGMAGDHGAPESGKLPRFGPEVLERQVVAKE